MPLQAVSIIHLRIRAVSTYKIKQQHVCNRKILVVVRPEIQGSENGVSADSVILGYDNFSINIPGC